MKNKYPPFRHLVWIFICIFALSFVLAGCSSTPADLNTIKPSKDYEGNAQEYLRLAKTVSGRTRSRYLLSAAENWLRAGRLEQAEAALTVAVPDHQDFSLLEASRLLTALLAQARGQPAKVLTTLEGLPRSSTSPASRARIAELRAWALIAQNQEISAVRVLTDAALSLTDPEKIRSNREALWGALRTLSDADLTALTTSNHPILGPWAELAKIQRIHWEKDPKNLDAAVDAWRQHYNIHPITQALIKDLLTRAPQPRLSPSTSAPPSLTRKSTISQVALVLPADGPAARAAAAVRDGFLAVWYESNPRERPSITFHSFRGGAIKAAYQAAVEAGATLIIGPLAKEEVQTLVRSGNLSRPTLALNYLPEGEAVPIQLYQFGLSPSDEAYQGAQQAWLDGRTRAFLITPRNDWGVRVRDAFRIRWESIGGTIASSMDAESKPEDLLDGFTKARNHPSPPGATSNSDFVFLATPAQLARRLSPLLQQVGLPVYATSHVLTGTKQDNQLADQQVVDLPWVVDPDPTMMHFRLELQRLWPNDFIVYQRIYALGVDAYRLMEGLTRLENDASARVHGVTGSLALDNKRRVVRQGTWVRIKNGQISSIHQPDNH